MMVWDMRCNRRSGHFSQPVNIISNAHAEKLPGTPQTMKKKSRRSTSSRPVMVKMTLYNSGVCWSIVQSSCVDKQMVCQLSHYQVYIKHQSSENSYLYP